MRVNKSRLQVSQMGFTLVEIMVGLAVGMLATLVIMQVMSVFEAQKRATTGTADAQTNGSIALYRIEREMQMAGYPLMPALDSPLECTAISYGATGITSISPVTIANGVSDTITIRYGDSASGGVPSPITALVGNVATLESNLGCQVNNVTLVTNGNTCAMSTATAVAGTKDVTLQNNAAAIVGATLSCMGAWNSIVYAVNNGNLERNGVPVVAGVVNLQAQYGVSVTSNSNQVTQWVDATGGTWAAPAVADRNRIKAVRIAVIARNEKIEPANVTTACSSTTAAAPTGLCAWAGSVASPAPTLDLSAGANWQRYRYRVFETIIPLRNMIWAKDTL